MCVCTHACASTYASAHTYVHGSQRGGPGVSPSIAVHVIVILLSISLNLGLGASSQQVPVIHLSLPISHSAGVITAMAKYFFWVAEIQTQVLTLGQQQVLPAEPSFQPSYKFHRTFQGIEFLHFKFF